MANLKKSPAKGYIAMYIKRLSLIILFNSLLCFTGSPFESAMEKKNNECGARIEIKADGPILIITGYYRNSTEKPVACFYKLLVTTKGGVNHTSNAQTGNTLVQPNAETALSATILNISKSEVFELELLIMENDTIICMINQKYPQTTEI